VLQASVIARPTSEEMSEHACERSEQFKYGCSRGVTTSSDSQRAMREQLKRKEC
jgi:hypothetical protein